MILTLANRVRGIRLPVLWLAAAGYWSALVLALHYPKIPGASHAPPGADKLGHALLYGTFTVLLRLVIGRYASTSGLLATACRRSVFCFCLIALQAVLDEWTQPLTGRDAELFDLVADLVGAACALIVYRILAQRAASESAEPVPAAG